MSISRREFLAATAATVASPFLSKIAGAASAADDPKSLAKIFEGMTLTDQYGKDFDPAELYKDKPVVVMFGFGGCQMCNKLSTTAAAVQAEVDTRNEVRAKKKETPLELPIIVVSVKPDQDRFKDGDGNPMKEYIESYDELGVRQFQEKKERDKPYENGKDIAQKDRILHVVTTQSGNFGNSDDNFPQTIQRRLANEFKDTNWFIPGDENSHSFYFTLFQNGVATKTIGASYEANEEERKKEASTIAKKLVDAALEKGRER